MSLDILGFALGHRLRNAIRFSKKEPIEAAYYLYNGVRLPALPEWDKKVYPYAYILELSGAQLFIVLSIPFEYGTVTANFDGVITTTTGLYSYAPAYTTGTAIGYVSQGDSWITVGTDTWGGESIGIYYGFWDVSVEAIWANTNINNVDSGTVHLAASDPVPVA